MYRAGAEATKLQMTFKYYFNYCQFLGCFTSHAGSGLHHFAYVCKN